MQQTFGQDYPEKGRPIGTMLSQGRREILDRWHFMLKEKNPQVNFQSQSELDQHIEGLLKRLISRLESLLHESSPQSPENLWGNLPSKSSFHLLHQNQKDLVFDYILLRMSVCDYLLSKNFTDQEIHKLIKDFFDQTIVSLLQETDLPKNILKHKTLDPHIILESTSECLFGLDKEGRCTFANASCLELLGFQGAEEIAGKNMHELIHYKRIDGSFYPEEECPIYQSFQRGEEVYLPGEVLWRADGTRIFADYRAHPILREGRVHGAVVSVTDVTQRKKAEEDLKESQEMLSDYFHQFPLPMAFFIGENYYYAMANAPYEELLNAKVVGKTLKEVLPDDQVRKFTLLMNEVYRTGERYTGKEVTFISPRDGSLRYIDLIYTPCRDKSGSITGLITTVIDVTEKVEARNRILASESRFKAISEKNPQIIWTASPTGKLTFLSNAWLELTGIPIQEVKDEGWAKMLHPDDRERVMEQFRNSLAYGTTQEYEFRLCCRKTSRYTWVLNRAHPIKNKNGEIIEWVGVAANITALKESQRALYDQAQFEQQLIGIISHDLRNPLTAIENSCSLLLKNFKKNSEEKNKKLLKLIENSAKRTISMVKDLLDFTRGRMTQFPLIPTKFAVLDAIFPIIEELRVTHPSRFIVVESYWVIRVEWDFPRFQQIVQNLLTNAIKYSPESSPIRLGLDETEKMVTVWIHNEGEPIPSERLKEIFEPLKRNVSESGNIDRSLGLGLHIVKKLAEAHGGGIRVKSTKEEGTTFVLELPKRVPLENQGTKTQAQ